jgi:hypothetical protein
MIPVGGELDAVATVAVLAAVSLAVGLASARPGSRQVLQSGP